MYWLMVLFRTGNTFSSFARKWAECNKLTRTCSLRGKKKHTHSSTLSLPSLGAARAGRPMTTRTILPRQRARQVHARARSMCVRNKTKRMMQGGERKRSIVLLTARASNQSEEGPYPRVKPRGPPLERGRVEKVLQTNVYLCHRRCNNALLCLLPRHPLPYSDRHRHRRRKVSLLVRVIQTVCVSTARLKTPPLRVVYGRCYSMRTAWRHGKVEALVSTASYASSLVAPILFALITLSQETAYSIC